jgi:WD40 repeat protein
MSPRLASLTILIHLAFGVGPLARGQAPLAEGKAVPKAAPATHTDLYGDPLPPGAIARIGSLRLRHGRCVTAVALSSDHKLVASCGYSGVRVWDSATGKQLWHLAGQKDQTDQKGWVDHVAFSPRGGKLVSVARFGTVRLWDTNTGQEFVGLAPRLASHRVEFSPGGDALIASTDQEAIQIWSTDTGKGLRSWPTPGFKDTAIKVSPDGKSLATGSYKGRVSLWEVQSGKELRRFVGLKDSVLAVAFSPGGDVLAAAGYDDGIQLWDARTGRPLRRLRGHTEGVLTLAFTADGKTLVSGSLDSSDSARCWDVASGRETRRLGIGSGIVNGVAVSADGALLAVGSDSGRVCLWAPGTWQELHPPRGHRYSPFSVAFLSDGKVVATAADNPPRLWAADTGKGLRRLGPSLGWSELARSADRKALAALRLDGLVRVWGPAAEKPRCEYMQGDALCVALSPDGGRVATGGEEGVVCVRDVATGKQLLRFQAHAQDNGGKRVECLAYSPDGKTLATSPPGGTVHFWDAATGKRRSPSLRNTRQPHRLAYSPDGRTLALSGGPYDPAQLWDVATGRRVWEFERGERVGTEGLAFSPDGKTLAVGGEDEAVRLWEVTSGEMRGQFRADRPGVLSLDFSPDGRSLAAGGYGPALVWDVTGLGRGPGGAPKESPRALGALWADLGGEDSCRAFQALWRMAAVAGPAITFLGPHLRSAERDNVRRLVAALDSDLFAEREKAERELSALGALAESLLREALRAAPGAELRHRAERLLQGPGRTARVRAELRMFRAVEVLEHIGTPPARDLLRRLAERAVTDRLRREGAASLRRLEKRPQPE